MRIRLKLERLKQELSKSNKSQNHWAITLGLSRGHLSEILNDRHPYPTPKTREKLLLGLSLTFEDLFELESGSGEWSYESSAAFQQALYGRYVIDSEIGEGGMGSVYLARDVKHGRRIAVKVISPEAVSGIGAAQFLKEIRYGAGLQHPHIMPLYDSGEAAGYPFFVMPFLDGGSLRDRMKKKQRFTLEETLTVLDGVTQALEHAHAARVVHCDIKPENILFAGNHAYLADFGISRAIHAEVRALGRRSGVDTSAGTPAYVSPEQAAGEPRIDAGADIYSLACVVFEMLSGTQPFAGGTATEVVARRFAIPPPRLADVAPGVPLAVTDVLCRAMAVDRADRHVSVTDFCRAFRRAARRRIPLVARNVSRLTTVAWKVRKRLETMTRYGPRTRWLGVLKQDLRFALRSYTKRWGRTAVLLGTAALGIGINTAVFSVVYAVLLRPLPFPEPDRLLSIMRIATNTQTIRSVSMASVGDIEQSIASLNGVGAFTGTGQIVVANNQAHHVPTYVTTERFFDVLGVTPQLGSATRNPTGSPVAVISHSFWQRAFTGDSAVLSQSVTVSGSAIPIVAVMPASFRFPQYTDVWIPQDLSRVWGPSRSAGGLRIVARMTPDATQEVVQSELSSLAQAITSAEPVEFANADFRARPLHQDLATRGKTTLLLLLTVVGTVLLIACSNIAAVLAADTIARKGEMVIRRSLGASNARLVRQLLTESVVLGLTAAVVALGVALATLRIVNNLVPEQYLHSGPAALDMTVAWFTLALGLFTGLLFGLVPALNVSKFGTPTENAARKLAPGTRDRLVGRSLVAAQYGLSLAVVVVAALAVRNLMGLLAVDPGFVIDEMVTAELDMRADRHENPEVQMVLREEITEELQAIPGVSRVSFISAPPLLPGANLVMGIYKPDETQIAASADWRTVAADYFSTFGIPFITGRDFGRSDDLETAGVVIVNQTLARTLWGNTDPLGQRIKPVMEFLGVHNEASNGWLTVVGVVGATTQYRLDEDPVPAVYIPAQQHPWQARSLHVVFSTDNTVGNVTQMVRQVMNRVDPSILVGRVNTMRAWVDQSASTPRFQAGLLSAFAGLAAGLVLLGMYGVTSQSLQQRRGEMAVRVALGADKGRIIKLLTGEGLKLIGAGQLLGTALILATTPVLSGLLFDVPRFDILSYLIISVLLAGTVLLSAYFPARRAGQTDPVKALRV